jgi:hypothetical protein
LFEKIQGEIFFKKRKSGPKFFFKGEEKKKWRFLISNVEAAISHSLLIGT